MASEREFEDVNSTAGLCSSCIHARCVQSDRGSLFYFCGLSATDPNFPKYPRLPVLRCSGFTKKPR